MGARALRTCVVGHFAAGLARALAERAAAALCREGAGTLAVEGGGRGARPEEA